MERRGLFIWGSSNMGGVTSEIKKKEGGEATPAAGVYDFGSMLGYFGSTPKSPDAQPNVADHFGTIASLGS